MSKNKKIRVFLTILFVILTFVYTKIKIDKNMLLMQVYSTLIVLVLFFYYLFSTSKLNKKYVFALLVLMFADVFFVYEKFSLYMSGLTMFMIYNSLLLLINIKKIGLIKFNHIFTYLIPIGVVFLSITYVIFASLSNLVMLIFVFGIVVSFLLASSLLYYAKSEKKASALMLAGAFSLATTYVFSGMSKLLITNIYYDILGSLTYSLAIYLITNSIITEDTSDSLAFSKSEFVKQIQ